MWHRRPEPGWQPSWWQSHTWASIGFFLAMPALVPAAILEEMGATNAVLVWLAIAFGFIAEFVVVYCLVYFATRYLFRILYGVRPVKTVA